MASLDATPRVVTDAGRLLYLQVPIVLPAERIVSGSTMSTPSGQLTPKQRMFVEYYCGADDGVAMLNATQAYIRAGYSQNKAHTNASKLLRNTTIRAHIDQLFREKALSRDEVMALVASDAKRSDDDIRKEAGRHSSEIVASSVASGLISSRTTARANLMRAHGMFTDNVNLSGGIDIRIEGVDTEKL